MAAYGYPSNLTGAGQTIAIIDAYKDSAITSDVSLFDTKYKLPAINLQVVALGNQANADWAVETSLDVEWVHAVAPGAKIVLVEAKTSVLPIWKVRSPRPSPSTTPRSCR